MLDYRDILKNPEFYQQRLSLRGYTLPLEELEILVDERRKLIQKIEEYRHIKNKGSKEFEKLYKEGGADSEIEELKQKMVDLGEEIKLLDSNLNKVEERLEWIMLRIPNIPADHTPAGSSEEDNEVIYHWGEKPVLQFSPLHHDEVMENLGIVDFKRATKLTGARFSVLKGAGTIFERAVKNFLFDEAAESGYIPVSVPYLVNRKTMTGTGQLPKFDEDMYSINDGQYYLIPTGEVPVTNLHAGDILPEEELPLKYCSLTPCFRSEAGSAGRDVKGLIRQHQFEKLELVQFVKPGDSWNQLEELRNHAEKVLKKLNLHYRLMGLCAGDTTFAARYTFDLEVWLPGQNAYREISSCSNYGDFQARRANIRYKQEVEGQNMFVHTLNGSAMPIGRTMVAIIEQYQQTDGSVIIPEALRPYTGFMRIFENGETE